MPTKIEWCDETINPQGWGCYGPGGTADSPEVCSYCYAKRWADRGRSGCELCKRFIPHWHPERLEQSCKWKRPRSIFWQDMGDLWHDETPAWQIRAVLGAAIATPRHTHLFLTKNPKRYLEFAPLLKLIKNCFCGVTVTNQADADELIPVLLKLAALGIKTFLSIEPMLGASDLTKYLLHNQHKHFKSSIHTVICGGETGPRSRPMHPEHPLFIRDQCKAAGVPFMFKGWGEWAPDPMMDETTLPTCQINFSGQTRQHGPGMGAPEDPWEDMIRVGRTASGRLLDGVEHNELAWRV